MSTNKGSKESRLTRCIKAPIRVLIKARDCYVHSLMDCSGKIGYGSVMGVPQISALPRSFSVNSSVSSSRDEDFRELVRIASRKSLVNKMETELLRQKSIASKNVDAVPRSRSVAIGRIDEDKPCDFGDDVKVNTDLFLRSRSCAVSSRKTGVF
ncbi:uncharacterized protein LOC107010430 [Solanum pennellii]|uniref:Uncharacterized protein n=5 Tax=Solanum subgen. Lycopersicon TaxID=49274 RepID=A0A3Q7FAX6_SOLLC|nr:uncharacterized protein LOC107010430 [Solanum pennellii]TMW85877.1 hypothetical protein EJD97_022356 [Solanum chilense]